MGVCHSTYGLDDAETWVASKAPFFLPESAFAKTNLTRDLPDERDLTLQVSHSRMRQLPLPAWVDLRPAEAFPVYNQKDIGSCTANALAAAFHFEQWRQGFRGFSPSRLFLYYNERVLEGDVSRDAGASLRSGIRVLHSLGVCDESQWPYDPMLLTTKPPEACFQTAEANRCVQYARVPQTLSEMKGCLAAGFPFVFGFEVFCDVMVGRTAQTGVMSYPPQGASHGGHAVQACGYDDAREVFIVRNSWGPEWGDGGHFYMPYRFITNPQYCHDFWAILFVEGAQFPAELVRQPTPTSRKGFAGGFRAGSSGRAAANAGA